jgi:phage shock protein C
MAWQGAPFRRSRRHRILGGVCGGMAEAIGWSPLIVRILFVVGSVAAIAVPGSLIYVILWVLLPLEHRS